MLELPEGQMLFTLKEVESHLRVSISTLHRWRKEGTLRAHKMGRQWRVPRAEVLRIAASGPLGHGPTRVPLSGGWFEHVERRYMVDFLQTQLIHMARDHQPDEVLEAVLADLTNEEILAFCDAMTRVLQRAESVMALRHDQPQKESL